MSERETVQGHGFTQERPRQTFDDWFDERFGKDSDFFPVDLDAIADGNLEPPSPSFLRRADGHKLLYPGMLHWLASEPEAGKSWLALLAVKELLEAKQRVVYFDYETRSRRRSG